MRRPYHRLALIPAVLFPSFLGLAVFSGCGGDDGTLKPMPMTEANKANIEAEKQAMQPVKKTTAGQP